MKNTRKALLSSIICLALCVTMLVGSTFAWFTDTATTGVNKITSGNLDVGLKYSADMADWKDAEGATECFGSDILWEPGYTKVVYFEVENKGSLALTYKVATNVVKNTLGKTEAKTDIDLTKYIKFGIVDVTEKFADAASARAAIEKVNDFSNIETGEHLLNAGAKNTFAVVVWMPEDTGNEANYDGTNVANKPEIQFGIQILASQAPVENDSFGPNYDDNAAYPEGPKLDAIVAAPKTAAELHSILETALTGGATNGVITINLPAGAVFDIKNEWTTPNNGNYSGVNKVVINGNGAVIKNLNQPLMSKTFAGAGYIEFNDLTIADSTIEIAGKNDEGVGAFLCTADASGSTIFNNCHLNNVKMTNTGAESYLGGFIGYSSSANLSFDKCSVVNCVFDGKKDIGGFIGYTTATTTVTDCEISGTTITSANTSTYRVGLVAGTINVNPATITGFDASESTVTQANASTTKSHDYCGRILADVYVDGTNIKP